MFSGPNIDPHNTPFAVFVSDNWMLVTADLPTLHIGAYMLTPI